MTVLPGTGDALWAHYETTVYNVPYAWDMLLRKADAKFPRSIRNGEEVALTDEQAENRDTGEPFIVKRVTSVAVSTPAGDFNCDEYVGESESFVAHAFLNQTDSVFGGLVEARRGSKSQRSTVWHTVLTSYARGSATD